jgi:hypothetical protein
VFPLFFAVLDTREKSCFERDQQWQQENGPNRQHLAGKRVPQEVALTRGGQPDASRQLIRLDEEAQQRHQQGRDKGHAQSERPLEFQHFRVGRGEQASGKHG